MAKVALVFGGRSVEHRVSVDSARTVGGALVAAGHQLVPFGIAPNGVWLDAETSRRALESGDEELEPAAGPVAPSLGAFLGSGAEVVFPIVHGTWGEDGTLQGLFETLDLPYVGAGVTASAVAMDKAQCKRLLRDGALPVVPWATIRRGAFEADRAAALAEARRIEPPLFVKPSVGGSSVGIRKLHTLDCMETAVEEALRFDDVVIVERGVEARELECSVLGYRQLEASRVGEIVPGREFYDYVDKYLEEGARLIYPAELPPGVEDEIRRLAVAAFATLGGWGMARVDFLLEPGGAIYLNEVNTLPGFTAISMYPKLWEISGLALPELADRLVSIALERHEDRRRLDAGIAAWLEELEER